METCYKCNVNLERVTTLKEGIKLKCQRCPKCGEEYFTSSELMRYDILKGNRTMIRKFGVLGQSTVLRIPEKVISQLKIKTGDYAYFEMRPEGILVKPISASKLKVKT
ncbi:MAG: AbrB/MazE/SpoVT family DNA-binding domain-containing protein [archaeon]